MTEAISQTEFDERLREDELVLAFVGMSNCGKSRWSELAGEDLDFERLVCDELIQGDLDAILRQGGYLMPGVEGITAMAEWMGQPGDERFREREAEYLALEAEKMHGILDWIEAGAQKRNTIIDPTGSVIYLPEICERLGELAIVVNFDTDLTPEVKAEMSEAFHKKPKPLVWKHSFNQLPGETIDQAIARCYPHLLTDRLGLYEAVADLSLSRNLRYASADTNELLNHIRDRLPA